METGSEKKSGGLKTRVLSVCVMLPLLILVWLGGKVLIAAVFIIALMGMNEFYGGFEKNLGIRPCRIAGYGALLALYAVNLFASSYLEPASWGKWNFSSLQHTDAQWYILWMFVTVLACLLYMFYHFEERHVSDAAATLLGVFYIAFFSYHLVLIDQSGHTAAMIWMVFLTAYMTDTGAYAMGRTFGKRKLCPAISPKKTVAGAIGGVVFSVISCAIFAWIAEPTWMADCIILGVLGGVLSQFGDLTASVFKRKMGVKDYSNLIPGHGGVMDRIDSVLFTAPLVYYYAVLFMN